MVLGPIVGSDMAEAQELPAGTNLELPAGGTIVDEHGADALERGRPPAPAADFPDHVLTAEMEFTGNDYVRSNADTSWVTLPVCRIPYPRLLRMGRTEWQITGIYFNTGVVNQNLEFELVIDGTPSGSVLAWNITAVGGSPSFLLFEATLRIVGSINGATQYDLEGRLRMQRGGRRDLRPHDRFAEGGPAHHRRDPRLARSDSGSAGRPT
jgi:hypothetical protein